MVANAHQNPDPEAMKTFDRGYLVAVVGFLVCIDGSFILDYYIQFENLRQCQSPYSLLNRPHKIGVAVGLLLVIFTIIISLRTRRNLNKLQEQPFIFLLCIIYRIYFALQALSVHYFWISEIPDICPEFVKLISEVHSELYEY